MDGKAKTVNVSVHPQQAEYDCRVHKISVPIGPRSNLLNIGKLLDEQNSGDIEGQLANNKGPRDQRPKITLGIERNNDCSIKRFVSKTIPQPAID